jgi:hypothetical protein
VVDSDHLDRSGLVVDSVNDPIDTTSGYEVPTQLSEQWLADSMGVIDQGSDHEFDDGGRELGRELIEPTFG